MGAGQFFATLSAAEKAWTAAEKVAPHSPAGDGRKPEAVPGVRRARRYGRAGMVDFAGRKRRNHANDAHLSTLSARGAHPGSHAAGPLEMLTLLGDRNTHDIVAMRTIEEATNADIFLAYLNHVLCPKLKTRRRGSDGQSQQPHVPICPGWAMHAWHPTSPKLQLASVRQFRLHPV